MIVTRLRQISLLLIAMAISALAFIQMFQRTAGEFPMQYAGMLALAVVLFLVLWGLIVRFQPYASQSILPCVLLLTATGVTMIARIDQSEGWAVAQRQLIWLCIAIVLSALLIIFLKDYRVLRNKELEARARATEPIVQPRSASATASQSESESFDDPIVDTTTPSYAEADEPYTPTGTIPPLPPVNGGTRV